MSFCKEFPYKEPLNIHSGISIWTNVGSFNKLKSFTRVESTLYPQLSLHYQKLTKLWYEEEKRRLQRGAS
jgi:hypothetical protein